jgi:hypothetical protein
VGAHSAPRGKSPLYLSIAIAVALAAGAWWVLFSRGSDEAPRDVGSPARTVETVSAVEDPGSSKAHKRSATGTVETSEVFASRDPFAPLVKDEKVGGESSSDERDAKVVALEDVSDDGSVRIDVNGSMHSVAEGEVFAENFKLLSVSGECASMLFGDDQFTLCEDEEILK